jgi:hypothetical protein
MTGVSKMKIESFPKQDSSEAERRNSGQGAWSDSYNLGEGRASGECCQWVLDAVLQTVEWLCQPLGFDSLTLRQSLDNMKLLDNVALGVMLKVFEGQCPVSIL